jgi:F420-dependent oxidoreductase-like protein
MVRESIYGGPMRFGLSTAPQNTTWEAVLAMWQAADEMDVFESAWTFDHFYPIFSDPTGPCLEGWVTLAALAQATRRLRVGCLVSGMPYRHPAVLANMAATLDVVSGGRLELGVGAGWNQEECDAYGIELGTLTERFDRFAEGVEVVHALLTQETATFSGRYFQLTDARCEPKGLQRPHPPFVIGGRGEKRTLPLVARWAQHWNVGGLTAEELEAKLEKLHTLCAEIGRDPKEIDVSVIVLEEDPASIARQARAFEDAGADMLVCRPARFEVPLLEALANELEPLTR